MSAAGGFGVLAGNFYGIGVFAGLLLGLAVGYVVVRFMVGGVAAVFVSPLQPSGKSVPPKRDYSIPQSLAVRGMYAQARNAWEGLVAEEPRDPDPYIELARLLRDHMNNPEAAAQWFRRARDESAIDSGRALLVTQELIELFTKRLNTPRKAIPELAYLVNNLPKSPATEAARKELEELRKQVAEELE